MNKLYKKNELLFAVIWIVVYVVGFSLADNLSVMIKIEKSITMIVGIILSVLLFGWMKNNGLYEKYGLYKSQFDAKQMLYYIPLILMASVNL